MSKTLPRPDVDTKVSPENYGEQAKANITITRDGKQRKYEGQGPTVERAVSDVVGKILSDPASAEYIP